MSTRGGPFLLGAVLAAGLLGLPGPASAADGISLVVRRGTRSVAPVNLTSSANIAVGPSQTISQTFDVAVSGDLLGIEVAPLRDSADGADRMFLDLYDGSGGQLLGSASIRALEFPVGATGAPAPLVPDGEGRGYFDLSALGLVVTAGRPLRFELRPSFGPGSCNLLLHQCSVGRVGEVCLAHADCDKQMRVGKSADVYANGSVELNGIPIVPAADLAFKVVAQASSPAGAVSLSWSGGAPPYDLFRSQSPQSILDAPNKIATTSATALGDLPPAGRLWYYEVKFPPRLDQFNLTSDGNSSASPRFSPGQTVTIGLDGQLMGIEIAPLRDTAIPGDALILEVFDDNGDLLASASRQASSFPEGAGTVPVPLAAASTGVGYFDLSPLGIAVTVGEVLSFDFHPSSGTGVCGPGSFLCSAGVVGRLCFSDEECDRSIRVGSSADVYSGGTETVNGAADNSRDLAFKVLVRP